LWFWNGLPSDARLVTAYLVSRGPEGDPGCPGDHLGIGGTHDAQGKLLFYNGDGAQETLRGTTDIGLRTWHHLVLVRDGKTVRVYLDGNRKPEVAGEVGVTRPDSAPDLFVGGRSDNFANLEGKVAEAAVYTRALTPGEVARHYAESGFNRG
jgi:Concanavalin A-like lectin/glucanases superfamily